MASHNVLGKWGEELAAEYLQRKGYSIIDRDWKSGRRDIDIVATDDDTVVFVEVKTRHDSLFGPPEESVDYRKRENLRLAINHYVKCHNVSLPIRFDIISIIGSLGHETEIEHFEDVPLI